MTESADDIWGDDLLGRREFADFLTKALVARTELISAREGQRGWTVALDAAWGAGKSFFIRRWTDDLRRQGYPVVLFDAWENDIGEEASVALMAEINEEMKQWITKLSKKKNIESKAKELVVDAGRKLRKSVMPVAKVVASGLLKKTLGFGLQEMLSGNDSADGDDSKERGSLASSANDILDKVFEISIKEHQQRKSDVRAFKKALVDLIDLIHKQANAKYPLFVFIDELDRCRPTYAISMLEEVKHIFGMDKVCFVVSTNLSQLRHSVCAVYGQNFDSEKYLKRFFDQSIFMPTVVSEKHIDQLYDVSSSISKKSIFLPTPGFQERSKESLIFCVSWIFRVFGFDARSQRQVFQMADNVAASIGNDKIHIIFLFFLCSLLHKNKQFFDDLCQGEGENKIYIEMFEQNDSVSYSAGTRIHPYEVNLKLSELISKYISISKKNWREFVKMEIGRTQNNKDPKSLIHDCIYDEYFRSENRDENEFPSISSYLNLVRHAGYMNNS